jgi:acetyltransferase-like isoleucine patch superfamily enzyme
VFHSKTIVSISKGAEFDINDKFGVGIGPSGATHPRIGRSKFTAGPEASVSHTGNKHGSIGPASIVHISGDFSIGDSHMNAHARIICGDEIMIGDNVAISWNFQIIDDDRHQIIIDGEEPCPTGPIEIQDNVWIGHDVSVHKDTTIHEGSVVASNSVVKSDIPPNTLAAGCPARVIKENVEWEW